MKIAAEVREDLCFSFSSAAFAHSICVCELQAKMKHTTRFLEHTFAANARIATLQSREQLYTRLAVRKGRCPDEARVAKGPFSGPPGPEKVIAQNDNGPRNRALNAIEQRTNKE